MCALRVEIGIQIKYVSILPIRAKSYCLTIILDETYKCLSLGHLPLIFGKKETIRCPVDMCDSENYVSLKSKTSQISGRGSRNEKI